MIRIPNPCSENPSNFTPTSKGGFCNSCLKEVVDFRGMSDKEVLASIQKNSGKTCGIFRPSQLESQVNPTRKVSFPGIWTFGFLGFLGLAIPAEAQTTSKPKTEKALVEKCEPFPLEYSYKKNKTIKGVVLDQDGEAPVPGSMISVLGYCFGTTSDINGEFELKIPDEFNRKEFKINISSLGYRVAEIPIKQFDLPKSIGKILVEFNTGDMLTGEVIIIAQKTSFWQNVKGIFRKEKIANCGNESHQHALIIT